MTLSKPMSLPNPKRVSGRHAAELVESGMTVGLGTGSTVFFALERLGERIHEQKLDLRGVPTSVDTQRKALEMGIPLVALEDVQRLDLTIDGADEVDPQFQMIKGGGGALLREKVVAAITEKQVIVVGRNKVVQRLGLAFPLPVEFVPFAASTVKRGLERLGSQPQWRQNPDGSPFMTDNGNQIFDCHFASGIAQPRELEAILTNMPGLVECGLFIDLAHVLVIGDEDGSVEVREKG